MDAQRPLYLGFDLSTQQLKALVVASDLKVLYEAKYDFDHDSTGFGIKKGVITNDEDLEVYAPIALWLRALDTVLQRLKDKGVEFRQIKGISGAGQQHGSVYWNETAEHVLQTLDSSRTLEEQLEHTFSYPFSPNWQDASTQEECDAFDGRLGNVETLASNTGSKAHHVSQIDLLILASTLNYPKALHRSSDPSISEKISRCVPGDFPYLPRILFLSISLPGQYCPF